MPQSVIPELEASISPVNMLQVQILGHYPRPTESETVGVSPQHLDLTRPPADSEVW